MLAIMAGFLVGCGGHRRGAPRPMRAMSSEPTKKSRGRAEAAARSEAKGTGEHGGEALALDR